MPATARLAQRCENVGPAHRYTDKRLTLSNNGVLFGTTSLGLNDSAYHRTP
jgi:hypothetical protein